MLAYNIGHSCDGADHFLPSELQGVYRNTAVRIIIFLLTYACDSTRKHRIGSMIRMPFPPGYTHSRKLGDPEPSVTGCTCFCSMTTHEEPAPAGPMMGHCSSACSSAAAAARFARSCSPSSTVSAMSKSGMPIEPIGAAAAGSASGGAGMCSSAGSAPTTSVV